MGSAPAATSERSRRRSGRIGGLICWENRMPLARYAVYRTGPADLAGADRRRLGRLAGEHAPHRDRVGRLRGVRAAVHPALGVSRTISRRTSRTRRSSSAAAPRSSSPRRETIIAGPLYDQEGIVMADCDLRTVCMRSAGSTRSATTAARTCCWRRSRRRPSSRPRSALIRTGRARTRGPRPRPRRPARSPPAEARRSRRSHAGDPRGNPEPQGSPGRGGQSGARCLDRSP